MEETRGNAAYTYTENIFSKQGYSKVISLRILAGDKRVYLSHQKVKRYGAIQQGSTKVMIVGDHGEGKTSLRKHLMELPFQQNEISTKSVEMYNVETVKVDKNWNKIPDDFKEYERVLNACAAYEYQQLPEKPILEQEIQAQHENELNDRKINAREKFPNADKNANVGNDEVNLAHNCDGSNGCDDSKFKSAGTVMKIAAVSVPALFVYGGFPSSFAVLHIIYVTMFCFLYKDLTLSHGYRFGQAFAILYFFIQNITVYWGIVENEHNFNCFEGLMALFVMTFYGFVCGILIGSGCRHGLAIACALVFSPTNHMNLTSLPHMLHMFSRQRLMQFLTISIGTVVGGGVYHLKEYNLCIVKGITTLSSIVFVILYYNNENIFDKSYFKLEVLRDFAIHHSMIFGRLLCGITFSVFFLTGLINYGRKIVTHTDKIHHCPRVALGLLFGILLANVTGASFYTFSYTQLVDIIVAILPTIIFEIHGFLQVYKHELDISEFCRSLKRLERQEEIVPLHIHIVDFAGDKEYHTSHQVFLAKGATYIVVFNLENSICYREIVLDRIKYWLNSILMYVGTGEHVFLVGTHKDKVNETDVSCFQKWLSRKIRETVYSKHLSFIFPKDDSKEEIFFAVKNPEKLSKDTEACLLRKKISQLARSPLTTSNSNITATDQNTEPVPLSWFRLLDVTRQLSLNGVNFIDKNEIFKKIVQHDALLTEEEFLKMLKYFNNRGDIRYDNSSDSLKDVVVLHSKIFRDTIVALVRKSTEFHNDTKLQAKGIVTKDIIDAALQTDNIEERHILRNLLEANDLILPLRSCDGETDYMLSGFLPEYNECDDVPHMRVTENVYYFEFYSFLLEKLFLKLIVKCKENSEETNEHKDPTYKPMIYKNAASFIQQCGENAIPYNIRTVRKSTSQNLIQICIGIVSDNHRYYMLENLNSWVRDIVKQYEHKPDYHLGFPCDFDGGCVHEEDQNHMHLYHIADKNGLKKGKQVSLVCRCTRETIQLDILPVQLSKQMSGRHYSERSSISDIQELLSDSFLDFLANELGSDKLYQLGVGLGIPYKRIREYPAEFMGKSDIIRMCNLRLLHEWRERNEGKCKVQLIKELAEALRKCELIQLADITEELIQDNE